MKTIITRANERGTADHGWLKPAHYFSFGGWQNSSKVHFGALRVLNDDWIAGGGAFPTHPHDNMEIVTIPFTGALKHKDSTGGAGIIQAGDVQIMSAGKRKCYRACYTFSTMGFPQRKKYYTKVRPTYF
jgi:quercetin 2,3-dioxygenase